MIRSLENRRILLKRTTRKISSQEERFLNFLRLFMSSGLPLMKNVLMPLAKNILIPLGLTAVASATYVAIQNKIFGSGPTALIISNEEINDIMKIFKSFEESGLRIKGIRETIKNEAKEQESGFLRMLLRQFETWLEVEVSQHKSATPVVR